MTFANQVAIITGASSGIGHELAKVLASQGAKVGLIARRREPLVELAGDIERAGGVAALAVADVGDRSAVVGAIHDLAGRLGPVDLLVANAGIGTPTRLDPINVEDVERMFRINVLGVVYSIEAVLPEMLKRKTGHVAAVSSMAAYRGLPGESAYCATKAAVNVYMEGLRVQLRPHRIAVTTLCPGFVKTPMTDVLTAPKPFMISAEDAARRIAKALRRRKKVLNFPWRMSVLMTLTSWLPDWVLAYVVPEDTEKPPSQ